MTEKKSLAERLLSWRLRRQGFHSHRTKTPHAEVHYYTHPGRPELGLPTLVFIHGIGAAAAHFHEVFPFLSQAGYPVLALDLPGHGLSSELAHRMTIHGLTDSFRAALSAVAPKRFIMIGNSLGGALSMLYASEHPERVLGLVLASPGFGFTDEKQWQELQTFLKVDTVQAAHAFLKRLFVRRPFYIRFLPGELMRSLRRKGVRELIETTRFEDLAPRPDLKLFDGKILLIWGREDYFLPRSNLEGVKKMLHPDIVCEEPPGIGHCPQLDEPRWFARRIMTFAESLVP